MHDWLQNVRVVLVGTTHPGNIGAAARAMKGMGLSRLCLVAPRQFPSAEATARAAGADDLLVRAQRSERLEPAVAECRLVVGTTARARSLPWPVVGPREVAARIREVARSGPVAVLFGRERTGLTNEELDLCNVVTTVPTVEAFSSLNVAAAVQLLSYEIRMAWLVGGADNAAEPPFEPLASADELRRLYEHWRRVMQAVGFSQPERDKTLTRRVRRLFTKAQLEHREVQILRGLLSAIEKAGPAKD